MKCETPTTATPAGESAIGLLFADGVMKVERGEDSEKFGRLRPRREDGRGWRRQSVERGGGGIGHVGVWNRDLSQPRAVAGGDV